MQYFTPIMFLFWQQVVNKFQYYLVCCLYKNDITVKNYDVAIMFGEVLMFLNTFGLYEKNLFNRHEFINS